VGTGPIPGIGYALRKVVVATDLAALRGPVSGRWQLAAAATPGRLRAGGRRALRLAWRPARRAEVLQLWSGAAVFTAGLFMLRAVH